MKTTDDQGGGNAMKWFTENYEVSYEYEGKMSPIKFRKELNAIAKTWEQIGLQFKGPIQKYTFIKDKNGWLRYRLEISHNAETGEVSSRKLVRTLDVEDIREKEAWGQ